MYARAAVNLSAVSAQFFVNPAARAFRKPMQILFAHPGRLRDCRHRFTYR
jgi:hypothetical protein